MELMEYYFLILRRKWVILAAFLIALITGIIYTLTVTPIYKADGKILIYQKGMDTGQNLSELLSASVAVGGIEDVTSTQVELMKTRPLITDAIQILKLNDAKGLPLKPKAVLQNLSISSVKNTELIQLSYKDKDPVRAAEVINTIARLFVEQNQKLNQEEMTSAREFLEKQLVFQRDKVSQTEGRLAAFKTGTNTISLSEETSERIKTVAKLESGRIDIENELKGLNAQKIDLATKINQPGANTSPFYTYWRTTLEQVKNQIVNLTAQINNLNAQITALNSTLRSLPPQEIQMASLMRNESVANEIYTNMLSQYEEIKVREAAKVANVKLIEPAVVPEKPDFPKKKKMVLLAMITGLMVGFGIALFLEYIDDRPHSIDEVKRLLAFPALGQIMKAKNFEPLFMMTAPHAQASEAVRLIVSALRFKPALIKPTINLMVTSATPGEGKSTVSANIAIALAETGKRVAVVNMDLRKPSQQIIFNISSQKGISDFLINEAEMADICIPYPNKKNIVIIPCGTVPPNPTELIASPRVQELQDWLNAQFEVIIWDTAPITIVAETLSLSQAMDGILLVTNMEDGSMKALAQLKDTIADKQLPILGVVYNKIARGTQSYYAYNSRYSVGYYGKEAKL